MTHANIIHLGFRTVHSYGMEIGATLAMIRGKETLHVMDPEVHKLKHDSHTHPTNPYLTWDRLVPEGCAIPENRDVMIAQIKDFVGEDAMFHMHHDDVVDVYDQIIQFCGGIENIMHFPMKLIDTHAYAEGVGMRRDLTAFWDTPEANRLGDALRDARWSQKVFHYIAMRERTLGLETPVDNVRAFWFGEALREFTSPTSGA